MTQLEIFKKYNQAFYEIVKLRYLTNQNNIKEQLDAIPLKQYKKQVKKLKNMSDFDTLQLEVELSLLEKQKEYLLKKHNERMKQLEKIMYKTDKKSLFKKERLYVKRNKSLSFFVTIF